MFNVLLSYPRSANSWVRYAVEYVSGRPTVGAAHHYHEAVYKKDSMAAKENFGADPNLPAIMLKRHRSNLEYDSWTKEDRFVFIIRDYRECILRNVTENTAAKLQNAVEMFVSNLEFFDAHEGDKLLIYYEDLMLAPKDNFSKIFSFLKIDTGYRSYEFIANLSKHRSKGINLYHDKAATQGATNKLSFHADRTKKPVLAMLDAKLKSRCPKHLYNKYLSRYRPY